MKYTLTNDSATVICDGKTVIVPRGAANFETLRTALRRRDWGAARQCLTTRGSVAAWHPRFAWSGDELTFDGKPVPASFGKRVVAMVAANEDPTPLLRFYERLSRNPSWRSVQQLFGFLAHEGLPIEASGTFLAYKGVRADYRDKHSNTFDNSPGKSHEMPRNEISDDADVACHVGFHVGALAYARDFAGSDGRVVVCRVDPEHVVCVPKDCDAQKVRVCKYSVVGNFGDTLPDNTMPDSTMDETEVETGRGPTAAEKLEAMLGLPPSQLMQASADELRELLRRGMRVMGPLPRSKLELVAMVRRLR